MLKIRNFYFCIFQMAPILFRIIDQQRIYTENCLYDSVIFKTYRYQTCLKRLVKLKQIKTCNLFFYVFLKIFYSYNCKLAFVIAQKFGLSYLTSKSRHNLDAFQHNKFLDSDCFNTAVP